MILGFLFTLSFPHQLPTDRMGGQWNEWVSYYKFNGSQENKSERKTQYCEKTLYKYYHMVIFQLPTCNYKFHSSCERFKTDLVHTWTHYSVYGRRLQQVTRVRWWHQQPSFPPYAANKTLHYTTLWSSFPCHDKRVSTKSSKLFIQHDRGKRRQEKTSTEWL